jgi:uncharacterized protein
MVTLSVVEVEWDDEKDRENHRKHGVWFRDASELFTSGGDYLEIFDDEHSITEDRFIAIGPIRQGLVLIIWTERDEDTIRIISARWASNGEQNMYLDYLQEQR